MLRTVLAVVFCCVSFASFASSIRVLPKEARLSFEKNLNGLPACPCEDQNLCKQVTVKNKREIFGFGGKSWKNFDWDSGITTIAWADDPSIVCEAHKRNVRIIAGVPTPIPLTANLTERALWIQHTLEMVQQLNYDGVTFDYESAMNKSSPERRYYTELVEETSATFHRLLPGSQVSVCVGWGPDNIDKRDYDYVGLAKASDFLYVMDYDTRSQIYGRCIASANSPAATTQLGLARYLDIGVPSYKLVLGIPWYGYDYPCVEADPGSNYCSIHEVPFRGVNCSDAAGHERAYADIMLQLQNNINISRPVTWDESTQTPYFNYVDEDGHVHQVWFDNAESLRLKYKIARDLDILGTGPFTFDGLDYSSPQARQQAQEMWTALAQWRD